MTTPERKAPNMKREFVVTNEEGSVSWNAKADKPETFKTFKAAKIRSVELAEASPGVSMRIYELTAETVASVNVPVTARKHPFEYYEG